ncbi:hypothetical protein K0M31_010258 [Melipona bicolor]|uniref:Uncharacterized protein n=1 Tax=Melipona bicolor TaxID=60889 RepID=A0AA40FLV1_9HYME|nr:hypothetical protein K0M31_010258 [Melipona bicolor]
MINITDHKAHNPDLNILNFSSSISPHDTLFKILTENILIALQWEAIFVHVIFNLNNVTRKIISSVITEECFPQLKHSKEAINEPQIDIKNVKSIKAIEQAGEKKRRKKKKFDRSKERKQKDQAEKAKREAEEKERLRKWEECWQKRSEAQEERDNAECCVGKGLCVKPRTQSNIWINVTQDRSLQEIHMSIKHVPVPKPKPPPLPPLKVQNAPIITSAEKIVKRKVDKKSGPEKKKKKSSCFATQKPRISLFAETFVKIHQRPQQGWEGRDTLFSSFTEQFGEVPEWK